MSKNDQASSKASGEVTGELVPTGIPGLDEILQGGLAPGRVYLLDGRPGTGKTTAGLQFLIEGVRRGERCVHVALSETAGELAQAATSHGWSLDGIEVADLVPAEAEPENPAVDQSVFDPSELEAAETVGRIVARVEAASPARAVVDSLAELRFLAGSPLRFRRQILSLKQRLSAPGRTVLLLDDQTSDTPDGQVRTIVHGVITLQGKPAEYGADRRWLRIEKLRAAAHRAGPHDYAVRAGGIEVFPRLPPLAGHPASRERHSGEPLRSGDARLDALLDGGPRPGTSTLLVGATGTGKSTLALNYAMAAARSGRRAAFFCFDQARAGLLLRAEALGFALGAAGPSDPVEVVAMDPAEMSPGAFAANVRRRVEAGGVSLVVLDSLNSYITSMPGERSLALHLHEMLAFLGQHGVISILTLGQHAVASEAFAPVNVSYLSDTVLLLRYYETGDGRLRRAIHALKNRFGRHEERVFDLHLGTDEVNVGVDLPALTGLLDGAADLGRAAAVASSPP